MPSFTFQAEDYPKLPGCYLMKDEEGRILYVGKSKSLRSRLRSYFQGTPKHRRIAELVTQIASIEVIVVNNEHESLLLENNLIKVHKPPYNRALKKDNSGYAYLQMSQERYPRLAVFYRDRRLAKAESREAGLSAPVTRRTAAVRRGTAAQETAATAELDHAWRETSAATELAAGLQEVAATAESELGHAVRETSAAYAGELNDSSQQSADRIGEQDDSSQRPADRPGERDDLSQRPADRPGERDDLSQRPADRPREQDGSSQPPAVSSSSARSARATFEHVSSAATELTVEPYSVHDPAKERFGPFASSYFRDQVLAFINDHYQLRTCDTMPKKVCLLYHLKRCSGVCEGMISEEAYMASAEQAATLLRNQGEKLIAAMYQQMQQYAERLEFERAAHMLEHIRILERTPVKQIVDREAQIDQDVIYFGQAHVLVAKVRQGMLHQLEMMSWERGEGPGSCDRFLIERYKSKRPDELIVSELSDRKAVALALRGRGRKPVKLVVEPKRGVRAELMQLCRANYEERLRTQLPKANIE